MEYTGSYHNNAACTWYLAPASHPAPEPLSLTLHLIQLDLEDGWDLLDVYSSEEMTPQHLVASFSGSLDALQLRYLEVERAPGATAIAVHFTSDSSTTREGFQVDYAVSSCDTDCGRGACYGSSCQCPVHAAGPGCSPACEPEQCSSGTCNPVNERCECDPGYFGTQCTQRICSGTTTDTRRSGQLRDRSTGTEYPNDLNCYWRIIPDPPLAPGETLQVVIEYWDLDDGHDYLYVLDGDLHEAHTHLMGFLTGSGSEEALYATSGIASVWFSSDIIIGGSGFSVRWDVITCGEGNCGGERGYCTTAGCRCKHGFDGDQCELLECFNDCSGRGSCIDGGLGGCACDDGWTGPYCADCPTEDCPGYYNGHCDDAIVTLNDLSGVVNAHMGPGNYEANRHCTWVIALPEHTETITLRFDYLDINDHETGVSIIEGSFFSDRVIGLYSGTETPTHSIHAQGNIVTIDFVSGSGVPDGRGFQLTYEGSYCQPACGPGGMCIDGVCECRLGFGGETCLSTSCMASVCEADGSGVCSAIPSADSESFCECIPGKFGLSCKEEFCSEYPSLHTRPAGSISDHYDWNQPYLDERTCPFGIFPANQAPEETVTIWYPRFEVEAPFDSVITLSVPRSSLLDIDNFTAHLSFDRILVTQTGDNRPFLLSVSNPGEGIGVLFQSDFSTSLGGFEGRYLSSRYCPNHCSGHGACYPQDATLLQQFTEPWAGPAPGASVAAVCACTGVWSGEDCSREGSPLPMQAGIPASAVAEPFEFVFFETVVDRVLPSATFTLRSDALEDSFIAMQVNRLPSLRKPGTTSFEKEFRLRNLSPGTYFFGVWGGFTGGEVSAVLELGCDVCHSGTCTAGAVCECDEGWSGAACDVHREAGLYRQVDCSSDADYEGTCVDLLVSPCGLELQLVHGEAIDRRKQWDSLPSTESFAVCQTIAGPALSFDEEYCAEVVAVEFDANPDGTPTGTISGCVRLVVSSEFQNIPVGIEHEEALFCFDQVAFVGGCDSHSSCLNGCSGNGVCRLIEGRTLGQCECEDQYSGQACEIAPLDMYASCRSFEEGQIDPERATEVCTTLHFGCDTDGGEPYGLVVAVATGSGPTGSSVYQRSTEVFDFDGAGAAVCVDTPAGCTVCASAPPVTEIGLPELRLSGCVQVNVSCPDNPSATPVHSMGCYSDKIPDLECHRSTGVCGDGVCSLAAGESAATCQRDCGCYGAPRPELVGDGLCDADNNIDCCWDGGDCCEGTCLEQARRHTCGDLGYQCVDPTGTVCADPGGIFDSVCPLGCSGQGVCIQGQCQCAEGYAGDACERLIGFGNCADVPRTNATVQVCAHGDFTQCPPSMYATVVSRVTREVARTQPGAAVLGAMRTRESHCVVLDDLDVPCELVCLDVSNLAQERVGTELYLSGCVNARLTGCAAPGPWSSLVPLGCFGDERDRTSARALHIDGSCVVPVCGDGVCEEGAGETVDSCVVDCACAAEAGFTDLSTLGDGFCDIGNNVECCWDGGDCCAETCVPGNTHDCGGTPRCISPSMACLPGERCEEGFLTADNDAPCGEPVCEPVCAYGSCVRKCPDGGGATDDECDRVCACHAGWCGDDCSRQLDECLVCGGDNSTCAGDPDTDDDTTGVTGPNAADRNLGGGSDDDDDDDDDNGGSEAAGWVAFVLLLVLCCLGGTCFIVLRNNRRNARYNGDTYAPRGRVAIEMQSKMHHDTLEDDGSTEEFAELDDVTEESVDTDIQEPVVLARPHAIKHGSAATSSARSGRGATAPAARHRQRDTPARQSRRVSGLPPL